jgi:hypothetical protein
MAGLNPNSAQEVNTGVGQVMRQFVMAKDAINRSQGSIAPLDLTKAPYNMSAEDDALIKTALNELDTVLDGINMVWINRLIGVY